MGGAAGAALALVVFEAVAEVEVVFGGGGPLVAEQELIAQELMKKQQADANMATLRLYTPDPLSNPISKNPRYVRVPNERRGVRCGLRAGWSQVGPGVAPGGGPQSNSMGRLFGPLKATIGFHGTGPHTRGFFIRWASTFSASAISRLARFAPRQ